MKGERRRFPKHRSTVLDILYASSTVPSFPLVRKMALGEIEMARKSASMRIGWTALFAKAYGEVCQQIPELRDVYVSYPLPYLYRHPNTVLSLSVHRRDDAGEERLIWGQIQQVETLPLPELQGKLQRFVEAPMKEVYRDGLILESAPRFARRGVWWWVMRWGARKRAKHVGTFSISSLAGMGCLNAHHPLVTPSSLAFGPLDNAGNADVLLLCDHRVFDGVLGAKGLAALESVLQSDILEELRSLRSSAMAA